MPINKLKTTSIETDAITADLLAAGSVTVADIPDAEITDAKLHTTLDFSTKTFTMHNNHITQAMVTQHQAQLAIGADQIDSGSPTFGGDVVVTGNLTVNGTTTTLNTETLTVDDNIIVLNNNEAGTPSQNAGIEVERGTSANVSLRWNETTDKWQFTNDGITYTDLGAGYANADVDAHLNQSTANTGEYLKWDGADYDWATVPAGYTDSDVDTHLNQSNPTSGYVLSWNGSDYSWVAAGGEITVQDEGSALSTAATTLNFVGAGVTATGTGAVKTISIAGTGGGATSAYAKFTYEITTTQSSVSGSDVKGDTLSYNAGNNVVEVFVNGVKQQEGSGRDYQATTGNSVVFTDSLYNGDIVDVVAYNMFDSANINVDGSGNVTVGNDLVIGNQITTASNGNVVIDPNGSGHTQLKSNIITGSGTSPASSDDGNVYIPGGSSLGYTTHSGNIVWNASFDSGWKYIGNNVAHMLNGNNDGVAIYTAGTGLPGASLTWDEKFRVDTDGYVGIGQTSPSYALDINGDNFTKSSIRLTRTDSGQNNDAGIYFVNNAGANDDWGMGGIWFSNSLDGNAYGMIRCRTDDASGTSGKLEFITGASTVGNTTDPSMTIDSASRVILKSGSPIKWGDAASLGYISSTNNSDTLIGSYDDLYLNSNWVRYYNASNGHSGTTEYARISHDANWFTGNTGIGTNGPQQLLHINGSGPTIRLESTDNNQQGVEFYQSGTKNASIMWGQGSANLEIKNFRNDQNASNLYANIDFFTGGSNAGSPNYSPNLVMRITDDGYVGIGEADPDYILDLKEENSPTIRINDGDQYQAYISLAGNDLEIRGSGGRTEIYNGSNDGMSSTKVMVIENNQRVGIGTELTNNSLTNNKLHVLDATGVWQNEINTSAAVLRLETNSGTRGVGKFGSGIVFNGLGGHSTAHGNNIHAWIGLKYYDTPGHERTWLVFGTNNTYSNETDHDAGCEPRLMIDPMGRHAISTDPTGYDMGSPQNTLNVDGGARAATGPTSTGGGIRITNSYVENNQYASGNALPKHAITIPIDEPTVQGNDGWANIGWANCARSGEVMHRNTGYTGSGRSTQLGFYIEAGRGEAGGICLDEDSFQCYGSSDSGTTFRIIDKDSDVVIMEMLQSSWNMNVRGNVNSNQSSFSGISDQRLKKSFQDVTTPDILTKYSNLDIKSYIRIDSYDYIKNKYEDVEELREVGLVAQEVEAIFPEAVGSTPVIDPRGLQSVWDEIGEELTEIKNIDQTQLLWKTMEAVQELIKENTALKERVQALESA